ncbi:MAG: hypothetical protein ACT4QA_17555 [Panacagrimonas sp.]
MPWLAPYTVNFTCLQCRVTLGYGRLDMDGNVIEHIESKCPGCGQTMARDRCLHTEPVPLKRSDPLMPDVTHKCWDCGLSVRRA